MHDKVDDKIVVSSEMLILESVSSQQPAFISAGESAVDCGKNFERPTTAATATTAINLEESVGRLLAKSKAPPLDFVDQSVVNCGDKRLVLICWLGSYFEALWSFEKFFGSFWGLKMI